MFTYNVTGTDANGCSNTDDVVIFVNTLPTVFAGNDQSVCAGSNVTLTGSGVVSYSWDNAVTDGVSFVPASTMTYNVTGTDANGCQNTDDVTVTVNTVNAATSVVNETITVAANGTYQWINCANSTAISGATGKSYTAAANGSYAVIVIQNGCSDTSSCQPISTVGIEEASNTAFSVYPNPTNGSFTLITGNAVVDEVCILDIFGKTVSALKPTGNVVALSLEGYANGIYFVRITSEDSVNMVRIIKQ